MRFHFDPTGQINRTVIKSIAVVGAILALASVTMAEATPTVLDISLTLNQIQSISIVGNTSLDFGPVTPAFSFVNTPNATARIGTDPWLLTPAAKIPVNISNNSYSAKLYVYTSHINQSYWTSGATKTPQKNMNGMINATKLRSDNLPFCLAPMRMWIDYSGTGSVTPLPNPGWPAWQWILDTSDTNFNTPGGSKLALLNGGALLMDRVLDTYVRVCWNAPKLSGTYNATLIFELSNQ